MPREGHQNNRKMVMRTTVCYLAYLTGLMYSWHLVPTSSVPLARAKKGAQKRQPEGTIRGRLFKESSESERNKSREIASRSLSTE